MSLYMLDTNIVSHVTRRHANVVRRLANVPMPSLCLSAITAGELMYGLAKRPDATRLHAAVTEFLRHVEILPWDAPTAQRYGIVRAEIERLDQGIGPLDLLIASHAVAVGAVLVTSDRAFRQVPGLQVEDWTADWP